MSGHGHPHQDEERNAEEQGDCEKLRLAERAPPVGRSRRSGQSDTGEEENDSSIGVGDRFRDPVSHPNT